MDELAILVRWDWFKLARRRLPWVLLVVLLLLSQLAVWGEYFRYRNLQQTGGTVAIGTTGGPGRNDVSCNDLLAGKTTGLPSGTSPQLIEALQAECRQNAAQTQRELAQRRDNFTLPGSIPIALETALTFGLILLTVLTASLVGAEYGWGTLRPILVRGTGRGPYLAAKLLLAALLAGAALIAVVAATAVSSLIANAFASGPAAARSVSWGDAAAALGKTWTGLLPFVVFTVCLVELTRSAAAAMAIGIGYFLGEQIVVAILTGVFSWFDSVTNYLLTQNIGAWVGHALLGQSPPAVSTLHAIIVLLAYSLALGGAAFYLFISRDVTGASGG
jgi:ABC-2 type transport system permease protein